LFFLRQQKKKLKKLFLFFFCWRKKNKNMSEWLCAVSISEQGYLSYYKIKRSDWYAIYPEGHVSQDLLARLMLSTENGRGARNWGRWTPISVREYLELTGHVVLYDFDKGYA
jgi:hypothetical protein